MKTLCPLCSDTLLRHLYRNSISWFCLRCHQEMPNLNLIKFNTIQRKNRVSNRCLENHEYRKIKKPIKNIYQTIQYQFNTIDLFIDQNAKRLEVISFIMNKVDLLLVNNFSDRQSDELAIEPTSNRLKYQTTKTSARIKARFLRDSELILLRICQAILVADSSFLSNDISQELIILSANSKFKIEKTYLIDLIKTLVIDFISSITIESSPSIDCFTSEISGYFEVVISSMLTSGFKADSV